MFQVVKQKSNHQDIVMVKKEGGLVAKLCLNEGGRIVEWYQSGVQIIGEPAQQSYASSYAGAILMPFVNRIEGGVYSFNGAEYQLQANEGGINAIHGLVYNRYFEVVNIDENSNYAEIHLENFYKAEILGYPFSFKTSLTYRFSEHALVVDIKIKNIGEQIMPYNFGWHPYFYLKDRNNASVQIKSKAIYETNDHGITVATNPLDETRSLNLSEHYDDAFLLSGNSAQLQSNEQTLDVIFSDGENFIQIYTPGDECYVAVEPMTGISNSFNNSIGLHTLEPNQSISKQWKLKLSQLN